MKIRYQNGEVSSVRNDLGRELVRAGLAEELPKEAPKPADTAPKFEVVIRKGIGTQLTVIRMSVLNRYQDYSGAPDEITARHFGGFEPPKQVVADYRRRWEASKAPKVESSLPSRPGNFVAADPRWEVGVLVDRGGPKFLAVRMTILNSVVTYTGAPSDINARRTWDGGGRYLNGFGREVPKDIADAYARRWRNSPDLRLSLDGQ